MIPTIVQLELTGRCNHLCQHCYLLGSNGQGIKIPELADEAMSRIAEILVKNKIFFVTLTGGEPLIRKSLVINLTKFLSENNVRVSLNTNAVLLDDKILSSNFYGILVSCPSADPETYNLITNGGNYNILEKKLQLLVNSKKHHTVNMVVSKLNVNQVILTAEKMSKIGIKRFAATPVSLNAGFPRPELLLSIKEFSKTLDDLVWIHENLGMQVDVMEALPKCVIPAKAFDLHLPFIDRSCYAGKRNGTISPTGDVRPCGHNPNIFGNILLQPIEEIWDQLSNWRGATGNRHRNCLACDITSSCSSGCSFSGHPVDHKSENINSYLELSSKLDIKRASQFLPGDIVLKPYKNFLSRPENEGWLLCSNSPRNTLFANKELYSFISTAKDLPPITLSKLAEMCSTSYQDKYFQSVMKELVEKSFFIKIKEDKSLENSDAFLS